MNWGSSDLVLPSNSQFSMTTFFGRRELWAGVVQAFRLPQSLLHAFYESGKWRDAVRCESASR